MKIATICTSLLLVLSCHNAWADVHQEVTQLAHTGRLSEALLLADQYLASDPRDLQMQFTKGVIQQDIGKMAEAADTFRQLTIEYPDQPEPYNNLAVIYASQAQFEKARSVLELAIQSNSSYAIAHQNLVEIYSQLAMQAYAKALQLPQEKRSIKPKLTLIRSPLAASNLPPPGLADTLSYANPGTSGSEMRSVPPSDFSSNQSIEDNAATRPQIQTSALDAGDYGLPTASTRDPEKEIENAVLEWARMWSARDLKGYFAAYSDTFVPPDGMERKTWERERTLRIAKKSNITVRIANLVIHVKEGHGIAQFHQDYQSGHFTVSSEKLLEFDKLNQRWLIVKEMISN